MELVYFKDVSYMLSHIFFMAFIYLFLVHRYSKKKTWLICFVSFMALNILDLFKLNWFPDSKLCYFVVDIIQIFIAQSTGILISKKRDSRVLFIGLSASNYVIVGSITSSILYVCTDNIYLSLIGNLLMHIVILLLLFFKLGKIFLEFYESDYGRKSWWELCLIPVFFFCSFSCLAFFPYTLYEYPENILVSIFLMITMLVSYVVVLRYVNSETKYVEGYWKNVMFESYIKGLESQYYLVEKSERNLKILRHDIRHYSMMISSLVEQGEYDEIKSIAKHINEVIEDNKFVQYCENLVVNTVFMKMAEQAQSYGILLNMDIMIPKQIEINEYEFALVVANLLENAVNSVKDMKEDKRYVNVKIHCTPKYLLVDIENECDEEIYFDSVTGLPKSVKGGNHGLGTQSVMAFSDKHNGNIECYCENNRFRIIMYAKF